MSGDVELRALVKQFIWDDARQRVQKMVTGLRAARLEVKWELTCPKYGVVDHFDQLPDVSNKLQPGLWVPMHFAYQGKIYWLDLPLYGADSPVWTGFDQPYATYKHTPQLDYAIWCEYARDPYGPQVPLSHTLEVIGNKRGTHERILGAGYHCEMAFFKPIDEAMSLERQYSVSFIRSFGLPGEDPVNFDEIDAQLALLRRLATESEPEEQFLGRGNSEDQHFLRKLKAKCYAIKTSEGPFASKFAFEVYKEVARYIDSGVPTEDIA